MFWDYWRLRTSPFDNVPDPKMYCDKNPSLEDAISEVLFSLDEGNDCLAVIVGGIGMGKTLALRVIMDELQPERFRIVFITNPALTFNQMLREIVGQLKNEEVETRFKDALQEEFNKLLFNASAEGKRVVIFIDEANVLTGSCLQNLRLLTNMQDDASNLVSLVLAGQLELAKKLEAPSMENLYQRIGVYCHIKGLETPEMVRDYVESRIERVGGTTGQIFAPEAYERVHCHSRGVPRLVNKLCKLALKAGETNGLKCLEAGLIDGIAAMFEKGKIPVPEPVIVEAVGQSPKPARGKGKAPKAAATEPTVLELFAELEHEGCDEAGATGESEQAEPVECRADAPASGAAEVPEPEPAEAAAPEEAPELQEVPELVEEPALEAAPEPVAEREEPAVAVFEQASPAEAEEAAEADEASALPEPDALAEAEVVSAEDAQTLMAEDYSHEYPREVCDEEAAQADSLEYAPEEEAGPVWGQEANPVAGAAWPGIAVAAGADDELIALAAHTPEPEPEVPVEAGGAVSAKAAEAEEQAAATQSAEENLYDWTWRPEAGADAEPALQVAAEAASEPSESGAEGIFAEEPFAEESLEVAPEPTFEAAGEPAAEPALTDSQPEPAPATATGAWQPEAAQPEPAEPAEPESPVIQAARTALAAAPEPWDDTASILEATQATPERQPLQVARPQPTLAEALTSDQLSEIVGALPEQVLAAVREMDERQVVKLAGELAAKQMWQQEKAIRLSHGDPIDFWERSRAQIAAQLRGLSAEPGSWAAG